MVGKLSLIPLNSFSIFWRDFLNAHKYVTCIESCSRHVLVEIKESKLGEANHCLGLDILFQKLHFYKVRLAIHITLLAGITTFLQHN